MASHTFRLVYDGLGATEHKMPTALEKQIAAGAQEFLGAHAHFFTEGRIPTNINDHSRHFSVHDVRRKHGSWEAIFEVAIGVTAGSFLKEYLSALTKDIAKDAASATKLGFVYLVDQSYKAWKERRPLTEQTFERIEPILTEQTGNRAPMIDVDAEHERQRHRLFDRVNLSMTKITAPIGRAAAYTDIFLDDRRLDRIERRIISVEEISAAILPLREQWESRGRL